MGSVMLGHSSLMALFHIALQTEPAQGKTKCYSDCCFSVEGQTGDFLASSICKVVIAKEASLARMGCA